MGSQTSSKNFQRGGGATPLKPPPGSASAKTYFGFTFDEFADLDCRAFSLFETVTGSLPRRLGYFNFGK